MEKLIVEIILSKWTIIEIIIVYFFHFDIVNFQTNFILTFLQIFYFLITFSISILKHLRDFILRQIIKKKKLKSGPYIKQRIY